MSKQSKLSKIYKGTLLLLGIESKKQRQNFYKIVKRPGHLRGKAPEDAIFELKGENIESLCESQKLSPETTKSVIDLLRREY